VAHRADVVRLEKLIAMLVFSAISVRPVARTAIIETAHFLAFQGESIGAAAQYLAAMLEIAEIKIRFGLRPKILIASLHRLQPLLQRAVNPLLEEMRVHGRRLPGKLRSWQAELAFHFTCVAASRPTARK
jgi:hypothetical protein